MPIWQKTEEELGQMNVPPPYWAFAWAGGQALARYLLDNAALTSRQARARPRLGLGADGHRGHEGAAPRSCWPPTSTQFALAAVHLNAEANGVAIETTAEDLLSSARSAGAGKKSCRRRARAPADVVLVGDLFYEREAGRARAGLYRGRGRKRARWS